MKEKYGLEKFFLIAVALTATVLIVSACQGPMLTGGHQNSGYTLNLGDLGKVLTVKSLGNQTGSTLNITIRDLGLDVIVFEGAVSVSGQTVNVQLKPDSTYSLDIVSGLSSPSPLGVKELRHSQTFSVPSTGTLSLTAVLLPYRHWYVAPYVYYDTDDNSWSVAYLDPDGGSPQLLDLGTIASSTLQGWKFDEFDSPILIPLRFFRNGEILLGNQFGSSSRSLFRLSGTGNSNYSGPTFYAQGANARLSAFYPDLQEGSVYHIDHTRAFSPGSYFSDSLVLSKTGGSSFTPVDLTSLFRYQIAASVSTDLGLSFVPQNLSFVPVFYGLARLENGDFVAALKIDQFSFENSETIGTDTVIWNANESLQAGFLVRFGVENGVPVVKASYPSGFNPASLAGNDYYFTDLQVRKDANGNATLYALQRPADKESSNPESGDEIVGKGDVLTFDVSGPTVLANPGTAGSFSGDTTYANYAGRLAFPAFFLNEPWDDKLVIYEDGGNSDQAYNGDDIFRIVAFNANFSGSFSSYAMPEDSNRNTEPQVGLNVVTIAVNGLNDITFSPDSASIYNSTYPTGAVHSIELSVVLGDGIVATDYTWYFGEDLENPVLSGETASSLTVDAASWQGQGYLTPGVYPVYLFVTGSDGKEYSATFYLQVVQSTGY